MARHRLPLLAAAAALFIIFFFVLLPSDSAQQHPAGTSASKHASVTVVDSTPSFRSNEQSGFAIAKEEVAGGGPPLLGGDIHKEILHGETIMPKLGNETAKAELGRASWKLLHTTLSRFPKKPAKDEREALSSFLYLFARLYPCGECATHFQALLQRYPPQTSSRDAAAQWGCFVHNLVNERLHKPAFDCGAVTEMYKCGCADADAEDEEAKKAAEVTEPMETAGVTAGRPLTAAEGVDLLEINTRRAGVEMQKEGMMNGG